MVSIENVAKHLLVGGVFAGATLIGGYLAGNITASIPVASAAFMAGYGGSYSFQEIVAEVEYYAGIGPKPATTTTSTGTTTTTTSSSGGTQGGTSSSIPVISWPVFTPLNGTPYNAVPGTVVYTSINPQSQKVWYAVVGNNGTIVLSTFS